uniref:PDZ binding kinase n=1 Tax=Malurus cyaneus samueli TaxID=2593467 RepID=A0A8C5UBU0_9PASS
MWFGVGIWEQDSQWESWNGLGPWNPQILLDLKSRQEWEFHLSLGSQENLFHAGIIPKIPLNFPRKDLGPFPLLPGEQIPIPAGIFPGVSRGISGILFLADPGPMSVTIPASPFMQKLGYGTGVSVYLMKRSPQGLSRSPWAVKKIYSGCSRSQRSLYQQRLQEEAKTLRNLQHPNIVGYRALVEAPDGSLCLAMEFGGEKSLNDLIEERREQGLGAFPAPTIFQVALSMARGLKYLHTEKRLLHGDIKSPNVVVKGAFESVKICDVGMSLPLDENLTAGGIISDRSDIFAFGLTLGESGWNLGFFALIPKSPFSIPEGSFSEDSFDEDSYYALLAPSHGSIVELFSVCTAELPAKRPPAARIVEVLEQSQPCPQ